MKISFLQALLLGLFMSVAQAGDVKGQEILEKKITVHISASLRDALTEIEKVADVKFTFRSKLIPETDRVSLEADQEKLSDVLDRVFNGRKIKYEADGKHIILTRKDMSLRGNDFFSSPDAGELYAFQVTGAVVDELNQPIPGASVLEKGTTNGTTTDAEGRYTLTVESENAILTVSFIGYRSQEIVIGSRTTINVSLQPDITTLEQVEVVGYHNPKSEFDTRSISQVKGDALTMQSTPNFESGLQGVVTGASVQSQSGAPGAPVRILVRGPSSINLSTDPLYIIDGMPISHSSYGLGSSNQSPMSLINQNDIENIEILKDAAATAIYGSRGSNGVIIVTTKSGRKSPGGSTSVNYSAGFSQLNRTPEDVGYANTQEWFRVMDEAYANSGSAFNISEYYLNTPLANVPLASPKLTREEAEAIDTDWYDELFDVGTFQSYNLSSSRGADKTSFYLSGNYRKDNGVQKNNDLERFSVRSNLDFNPTENLTVSSKLTFGYSKNNQRNSGITSIAENALPWFPVKELDNPNRYFNAYTQSNPAALSDPKNVLSQVEQYRGLGGLALNYRVPFVAGLSLQTELSGDIIQSNRVDWSGTAVRPNSDNTKGEAAATEEAITFNSVNYNAYARYSRNFGEHYLALLGGFESTRSFQYTRVMAGTGLTGTYQQVGQPSSRTLIKGQKEYERYLLGYFGRAEYRFKDRYLFGFSVRRDGSSVFTEANRWGTFVAVSGGWVISDEKFMGFMGGKVFLKLRGSYGEVGNQNVPPSLDVIQYNDQPFAYGSDEWPNGTAPVNLAVQDLQWETTKSSDVGIDFGFWENRVNGSVAYYHRYVDGMLLKASLPLSTGIWSSQNLLNGQGSYDYGASNSIWGNFGDMVNSGFEFELHSVNIDKGGFKWKTDINFGFNKNEIKGLTSEIDLTGGGLLNRYGNAISRTGDQRGTWYIADYAGVDPTTGVPYIYALDTERYLEEGVTVRKTNGNLDALLPATTTNIRNNKFYQPGKSADPKYQAGLTNTFIYKGFDLSILVVFSGGNYILDYDRQRATIVNPTRAILKEVYEKAWRQPGDIAEYPQLRSHFTYVVNGSPLDGFSGADAYHDDQLYKGDFIRLRNVQLGYTLPAIVSDKVKMKNVRLFVSGSNLFTFTDYPGFDPEGVGTAEVPGFVYYANAIPQLKTLTVGLDARF